MRALTICLLLASVCTGAAIVRPAAAGQDKPWLNSALSADERADLLLKDMTPSEKLSLLRGRIGFSLEGTGAPHGAIGSAGFVPGIPRLGIPSLQETDAGLGIANPLGVRPGDVATPLPSGLATAASFDPSVAYDGGAMIGRQAWRKGFNVLLAGGVNLARDPRNGRNFEYFGEDPLLAGTMDGEAIRGIQDQHVISTVKHFVLNDQETGRYYANAVIGEAAMRESDLLAFEIAIERGRPGSVMCSYNLINGSYGCGNAHLLNDVLKGDWHFPGWVMSDWGAVHDVRDAAGGLDQESAGDMRPEAGFFGKRLDAALADGTVPAARLNDMVRRILRSMFAVGLFEHPPVVSPVNYEADSAIAQRAAEEGIVLLKNSNRLLPLTGREKRIAIIGGFAENGVLSGGGSSQVLPAGGPYIANSLGGKGLAAIFRKVIYDPSSPAKAIGDHAPNAELRFADGRYPSEAVKLAAWADVVIVFAEQWMGEGLDAPDLTLPSGQDALIAAVTQGNPKTIVVLETGGPVLMPWLAQAAAVVEAWYPGVKGGEAIANVLFGAVNPSGHLPMTFPADLKQNPRPILPGSDGVFPDLPGGGAVKPFDVVYSEGSDVGYRGIAKRSLVPLFPFGYGLSYTTFGLTNLMVTGGQSLTVDFDVTNTGTVAGKAVPQVYLIAKTGAPVSRLIGFSKVALEAGQTRHVRLTADPRLVADFDAQTKNWRVQDGSYEIMVGYSAGDVALKARTSLTARTLAP